MAIMFYSVLLEMETDILECSSVKKPKCVELVNKHQRKCQKMKLTIGIFKKSPQNEIITRQTSYIELYFQVTSKNI